MCSIYSVSINGRNNWSGYNGFGVAYTIGQYGSGEYILGSDVGYSRKGIVDGVYGLHDGCSVFRYGITSRLFLVGVWACLA